MTSNDSTALPEEPTPPAPTPPAAPAPAPAPARSGGGPGLGHIVLGAVLVLIGVGWLLEALDVTNVPWRYLLPSALIIVGIALVLGARTGRHGGLVAVGVVLTVLVLLAGAVETLVDIPLSGGVGDETRRPTTVVEHEYHWGLGKMTLDLRQASALAGEQIQASVVVGELIVIVPPNLPLVVTAHSGVGDVVVLGEQSGGLDVGLDCVGTVAQVDCGDNSTAPAEPFLRLDLEVAIGKVEVQR